MNASLSSSSLKDIFSAEIYHFSASSFCYISYLLVPGKLTSPCHGSPSSVIRINHSVVSSVSLCIHVMMSCYKSLSRVQAFSPVSSTLRAHINISEPSYALIPASTLAKRICVMFSIICLCPEAVDELSREEEGKGCSVYPQSGQCCSWAWRWNVPSTLIILRAQGLGLNVGWPFNLSSKLGHFWEGKRHH